MSYIHQQPDWPHFTWDGDELAAPLAAVRHQQGRLLGRMQDLGFDLRAQASLGMLTSEVVRSSAIEGETLDAGEVRSSVARRLGLDTAGLPVPSRAVEGIVEMMLDATGNFAEPLTSVRLFGWHAALFPTGHSGMDPIAVGEWRPAEAGPMQVVSGHFGRERVHFEAPTADRLGREMAALFEWFNSTEEIDPVLKAGMVHLWFVTVHPFEDGNGRIARALAEMALARSDGVAERFYSMSTQIEAERKQYYRELESAQRGDVNITRWLVWFLGCLSRALDSAEHSLAGVLHKARLWDRINRGPVNERQRLVINRLLDDFQGHLTTGKYAKLAKCSSDTALRDIRELLARNILLTNPGRGRSTSYRLAEPEEVQA